MKEQSPETSGFLSISEMAKIMGISRQTLIYYDKINLFKPEYVDKENGYRYYSAIQLPLLRDICFLKSIGVSLKDIQEAQVHPSLSDTIALFRQQSSRIEKEINQLKLQQWEIEKRIYIYEHNQSEQDYTPLLQSFPERILLSHPWDESNLSAEGIHQILKIVWNQAKNYGLLPPRRWGTLLDKNQVVSGSATHNARVCCQIEKAPASAPYYTLPAGEYVCMPKFGMPYQTAALEKLLHWIGENHYEIIGDIYDECLMDASFYIEEKEMDFSEIQIPVRTKAH